MIETNTEGISIRPERTAFIAIDLQEGIVHGERAPHSGEEVVERAARIADACRAKGMPIFWVRVTPSEDRKDALTPPTDAPPMGGDRPAGWAELVPETGKQESDFVITKRQWGAFYGTELDLQLRRRGIDTLILCGIATDIGVESTARFAYEYGYAQVFVEDAMTTFSAARHEASVAAIFPRMGKVRSTGAVLAALA